MHELTHAGFVKLFGGKVGKIKPSLVGLQAWVRGIENLSLWKRYVIYLAGPGVNALISIGALIAARFLHIGIFRDIFLYNAVLAGFNLLPALPLDGGRIAQLFLGNLIGVLRANRLLLKAGPIIGAGFIGFGLVQAILYPWNITLLCAGMYIRWKNKHLPAYLYWECLRGLQAKHNGIIRRNTQRMQPYKIDEDENSCVFLREGIIPKHKKALPTKKIILPQGTTVRQAVEYLRWDYFAEISIGDEPCILEKELLEKCGIIFRNYPLT